MTVLKYAESLYYSPVTYSTISTALTAEVMTVLKFKIEQIHRAERVEKPLAQVTECSV